MFMQIINAVLKNPEDGTQISLLYANQTSDDILLRQQLDALAEKHDNFRVWHTSEQGLPALWTRQLHRPRIFCTLYTLCLGTWQFMGR
jgi:NAD(P)H-flavin reductase